jgi:hypothetical protein
MATTLDSPRSDPMRAAARFTAPLLSEFVPSRVFHGEAMLDAMLEKEDFSLGRRPRIAHDCGKSSGPKQAVQTRPRGLGLA